MVENIWGVHLFPLLFILLVCSKNSNFKIDCSIFNYWGIPKYKQIYAEIHLRQFFENIGQLILQGYLDNFFKTSAKLSYKKSLPPMSEWIAKFYAKDIYKDAA